MSRFYPGRAASTFGWSTRLRAEGPLWTCPYEYGAEVCGPIERWTMWRASTRISGGTEDKGHKSVRPQLIGRACRPARSAQFLSLRQTPDTMPKSITVIEEEDVEKQTLNSAPDEEAEEEEFEIERILAYEPNRFISEQTKKVCGLRCDEFQECALLARVSSVGKKSLFPGARGSLRESS